MYLPLSTTDLVRVSSGAKVNIRERGKMNVKLSALKREESGKGASRRARRNGQIPAVVYGRGVETLSVLLPAHETFMIVKDTPTAVISLDVEGTEYTVLLKEVQRHPVRRDILHVDLLAVSTGERVVVEVPLRMVGSSVSGTKVTQEMFKVAIEVSPETIPTHIEVSLEGLEAGTTLHADDLVMPEGVKCAMDERYQVLTVSATRGA